MKRERFLVKSLTDNDERTKAGLVKVLESLEAYSSAVIVVPKLENISSTMLTKVLGESLSKQLIKDREIAFTDNKKVSLCSQATLKNYKYAEAYLALWGSEQSIQAIEALTLCKCIVFVTWSPKDSEKWEINYNVEVIYDDQED